MPSQKRQRQRSLRAQQAAAAAARRRKNRSRAVVVALLLTLLLVLGVASIVGGGGSSKSKRVSTSGTTAAPGQTAAPGETAAPGSCTLPAAPEVASPPPRHFGSAPPMSIDTGCKYTATMVTNQGTMTIDLDPAKAPRTVNNFVFLARNKFFDGLKFHRVVPGFVAQGGSPDDTASGDVGYKFDDELPKAGGYKIGSLAMANSGPNTNGSQFFIITGPQGVSLPPSYSLFGQVTQGLDVVSKIDSLGVANPPSTPKEPVIIQSVTIDESAP